MTTFANKLITWQKKHGRHHLPWQNTQDPYAIWLSEIMLQQTQVQTVIPYYLRFIQQFPNITQLATAPIDSVLAVWSGLGYYARARHLHQAAKEILNEQDGQFPTTREAIEQLPGIGRSTAAAIAVFAFSRREAILDGNVKRILTRYFGIFGYPGNTSITKQLWHKAEQLLPINGSKGKIACYTQALMDLGSIVCTRRQPACQACPLQNQCIARINHWTAQLPTPKKQVALPEQHKHFLIFHHQQKIFLRQMPEKGIWGKLWSFPEMNLQVDLNRHCQQTFNLVKIAPKSLPMVNHQFTHFKLKIYPQLIKVDTFNLISDTPTQWLQPAAALNYALPAPVKKIIHHYVLNEKTFYI